MTLNLIRRCLVAVLAFTGMTYAEEDGAYCASVRKWFDALVLDSQYVELSRTPGLAVSLPYSDTVNLAHFNLYCGERRVFLHKDAARKLLAARDTLRVRLPGWRLRIRDAARPPQAQAKLFALVAGTPDARFVTNPRRGSLHSYGMAVDVDLLDSHNHPLDMGTEHDALVAEAAPSYENEALARGTLDSVQVSNRRILRAVMHDAGWIVLGHEWWHFNAASAAGTRARMTIVEPL